MMRTASPVCALAIALCAVALSLTAGAVAAQSRARSADVVLLGGKIFTADSARPWAEAIAITGERVVAVGTSAEIRRLVGAKTKLIELGGRVVVPGFNDAHQHISASAEGIVVPVGTGPTPDPPLVEVLDSLRIVSARAPRGNWLWVGVGERVFSHPQPLRAALDQVAPDHPVALTAAATGHGLVLNSAALRSLALGEAVPDPAGGTLERDADGRLTGVLQEYAGWNALGMLIGRSPDSVHAAAVSTAATTALALGVTSIQDMAYHTDPAQALRAVQAARPLARLRMIPMPTTDAGGSAADWRAARRALRPGADGHVRVAGLKWILDGTPVERFALMRAPYADRAEWHGWLNFPVDTVRAMLRAALSRPPGADGQLMLHLSGDSSAAVVLQLMSELAPDTAWRSRRVRFEHADGLMDDLQPLARRLGVIVVQNPAHFTHAALVARLGPERAPRYQPFRSLAAGEIPIAIGSDGPVNPFLNIFFATLHPNNPAEAISREQAVIAYTRGSAYAEFAEHEKGRLATGLLADLAVLSQDIFTVPPQALPQTTSVLTMVGGRVVHDGGVVAPITPSPAPNADRASAAPTVPAYADTAQLRAAAQSVVNSFHARAVAAGLELGPAPVVEVRTTPQLIFYLPSEGKIVMPWWADLVPAVQQVFARLGGGDAEGELVFRAFFHRFFIAHEAAHWLRHRSDTRKETLYAGEDDANRIAVAYWRTQPDGEAFLAELERMLVGIVARIPDPTPAGEDPVAFFGANYQELGRDPMKYGYYQFRFVLDAVRERSRLDYTSLLADAMKR